VQSAWLVLWIMSTRPDARRGEKESWMVSAQSCAEQNSEAFAGQHAATSTSFYIFDEASGVPDKIFEVAEGALTDGEPMVFLFGNPTRKHGQVSSRRPWRGRGPLGSPVC